MSPTAHLQAADSYMQSQAVNLEIKSFRNELELDTSHPGNPHHPYDLGTEIHIQQNRSIPHELSLSGLQGRADSSFNLKASSVETEAMRTPTRRPVDPAEARLPEI